MSLTRTLMNGGTYGVNIAAGTYGHSNGALKIAMESTEELHEIFTESFYNMNQIELNALHEGVSLDDSKVVQVMEATGAGVLEKIKNFFKKLWAKVKEFFHNVKRFIDSIFMSGKDFASKYKSDIDAVKGMKNFEYKMFTYRDTEIDDFGYNENSDIISLTEKFEQFASNIKGMTDDEKKVLKDTNKAGAATGTGAGMKLSDRDYGDKYENEFKKDCETKKKEAYTYKGKSCDDTSELAKEVFSYLRNGANDSGDKDTREFTEVSSLAKILTSSKASSNLSKAQSKTDNMYKKCIAAIDKAQSALSNVGGEGMSMLSDCARELSSTISECQSADNTIINGHKEAYKERDAAYKACIMAAFTHFKKQNAKK